VNFLTRPLLLAAAVLAAACGDGGGPTGNDNVPAQIAAVSGGGQEATVGTKLPAPLVVKVTNSRGAPVAGAAVSWAVTAGGGTLSAAATTTDASGQTQVEWTAGTRADLNTAQASVVGAGGATFSMTPRPGPAAKLEKVSGDAQPGAAGAALPTPLAVRVTDTHGNAVAGALVSWSVSAGGQASPAVSASDANGLAQTVWTVAAGANTATATSGTLAAVSFTSVAPTDVRGIIASSTTWTRANSPYRITGVVQVAQGATLTIEPGVRVYPGGDSTVEVFGSLRAQGTPESRITLDRLIISGRAPTGTAPELTLAYADLTGGVVDAGNSVTRIHHNVFRSSFGISVFPGVAEVRVEDNEFRESIGVSSGSSRYDVYIQRNLFVGSSGITVTANSEQGTFFIRSNSFYDLPANLGSLEFQALRVPGNVPMVLENNNFWSTNRVAVRLTSRNVEHVVNARNNFWNTTDPAVIAAMIVDRSDDLNIAGRVEFTPFLTAPAPGAPVR
jgi:hypothetical protein